VVHIQVSHDPDEQESKHSGHPPEKGVDVHFVTLSYGVPG
jgi:hypothetical protein